LKGGLERGERGGVEGEKRLQQLLVAVAVVMLVVVEKEGGGEVEGGTVQG